MAYQDQLDAMTYNMMQERDKEMRYRREMQNMQPPSYTQIFGVDMASNNGQQKQTNKRKQLLLLTKTV